MRDKIKKYRIYFEATITGFQIVEAFDGDDAEQQFDAHKSIDDFDDNQINAEIMLVTEEKPKRIRKKSK